MSYPTNLDSFTTHITGDTLQPADVNDLNTAVGALEAKVGVDSSAVATSIDYKVSNKVDKTTTVNGHALSGNVTVTASDVSAVPTTTTVNGKALSGNITLGLASSDYANQGTTTTVLHGNAAGNPAFGAVVEADITLADNTTNDVATTKHGLVPKAPNDTSKFLRGDATWATTTAPSLAYKNGIASKNAADASATQTIAHGLGKTPSMVRLKAILFPSLTGQPVAFFFGEARYNGTTQVNMSLYAAAAGASVFDTSSFVLNAANTAATTVGVVTVDGTNISIAWTKTGSATGTYSILWEVEG